MQDSAISQVCDTIFMYAETDTEKYLAEILQRLRLNVPSQVLAAEQREFLVAHGPDILISGWCGNLNKQARQDLAKFIGWDDAQRGLFHFLKTTELGSDLLFLDGDCLLTPNWVYDLYRERSGEGKALPIKMWGCSSVFPFPQGMVAIPVESTKGWFSLGNLRPNIAFDLLLSQSAPGLVDQIRRFAPVQGLSIREQWLANPFGCLCLSFEQPRLLLELFLEGASASLEEGTFDGSVCDGAVKFLKMGDDLAISENLFLLFPMLFQSDWNGMPLNAKHGESVYYEAAGFMSSGNQDMAGYRFPPKLQSLAHAICTNVRLDLKN